MFVVNVMFICVKSIMMNSLGEVYLLSVEQPSSGRMGVGMTVIQNQVLELCEGFRLPGMEFSIYIPPLLYLLSGFCILEFKYSLLPVAIQKDTKMGGSQNDYRLAPWWA